MALFKALKGDASRISTDVTPYTEGYVYLTNDGGFYVDAEFDGESKRHRINPKDRVVSCTLSSTGWSGNTQVVTVADMAADADGGAFLAMDISDEALSAATAARMRVTGQAANQITVTAKGTVPDVDIPIVVIIKP